jgi:tetratricopeptide (TPR) repeat protein
LRLFKQFLQESDLDAAQQCVDVYQSLLADVHTDVLAHNSDSASFSSELDDVGRPIERQSRYHVLIQLARTLEERNRYAGGARDLEYAARHGKEALSMCRAENTVCPTVYVFYADILSSSFEVTGNFKELQMAEMLCRDVIPLCSDAHPLSSTTYHTLSWVYMQQFLQSGGEAVIDQALYFQRIGLERLPETESHNKHRHLRRLAGILTRQLHWGEHENRDDALSIMSEAFRLCPPMHVDRCMVYSRMMWQLHFEYTHSGELELLNRAIELGRQALDMGEFLNISRQAIFLFRMAESLRVRYHRAGASDKDLEESIELFRRILHITLPSDVSRWVYVDGLAGVLVSQFLSDGDMSHLEEASQLYHHTSHIIPTANPWRPDVIAGYAHTLGLRFRETGDISELNRAIELDKEALDDLHPSSISYSNTNMQIISHLCLRFEIIHNNNDLAKATTLAKELLRSLPDGDINRPEAIHLSAKARLLRAIDEKSSIDIDSTIEQLLSVKDELSRSNLGPESLRTLAACYMVNFRHSSSVSAALSAKDAIEGVLESVDPSHYERFQCLIDAAKLYMEHGTPYYDIDIALKHLSEALNDTHRDVRSKIRGAKDVLDKMEVENHYFFTSTSPTSLRLLDIIECAVSLLPRVAFFGIYPYSRLQSLKQGQIMAMTGASHALNGSLLEKALEIMEQGRAIFWTHTLRLRSPFDEIPQHLRDPLLSLARRLEKIANASENSTDQQYIEGQIARRRNESNEFNSLVEQVRCLPGLERFMLPSKYSTLKCVADQGPVVVLVSSALACHAIILKSSDDAVSVRLEVITEQWLMESASVWRSTAIKERSALRDGRKLTKAKKARNSSYTQAELIMRLLWTNVVWPVIQALHIEVRSKVLHLWRQDLHNNMQPASDRDRPRIWWCPTGCFAHLPIHAAGSDGKWCSDYVVSSYTPTISSLLGARMAYAPVKKHDVKALIAAVPRSFSPLLNELTSTNDEVNTVRAALPEGTLISLPGINGVVNEDNFEVTAEGLLDKLPEATILHLACHGRQDPKNPLHSGFAMSDEMLTIERLMQVQLPRAFMAFLSACETAKGDQVSAQPKRICAAHGS